MPPPGIYGVKATLQGGNQGGAIRIGPRPTFSGSLPSLERHLLEFEDGFYGEETRVELIKHRRDGQPLAPALMEQFRLDGEVTRFAWEEGG